MTLILAALRLRAADPPIDLRIMEASGDLGSTHSALMAGAIDLAVVKHNGTALRYDHDGTEYSVALAIVEAGFAAAVVPLLAIPPRAASGDRRRGDRRPRRIAAHSAADRSATAIMTTIDMLRQ